MDMSVSVIIVPVIVTSWPTILPVLTAAAAAMGFSMRREGLNALARKKQEAIPSATVVMENSALSGAEVAAGEMVVTRGDVTLKFSLDGKGHVKVCTEGPGKSKAELEAIGRQAAGRVAQMYAYNQLRAEAANMGFSLVEEQVDEKGAVHIRLRRE
jgi:hypothetical protein